jgi:hypothetical protein
MMKLRLLSLSLLISSTTLAMPLTAVVNISRDDRADDRTADYSFVVATIDGSTADVVCSGRDTPLFGMMVIECDIPDAMAAIDLVATLSIDNVLLWSGDIGVPARVGMANTAQSARNADAASSLVGGTLVPRSSVTGGTVSFPFANVVGAPADIQDGDQGNLITTEAPLSLSGGTLVIGVLQGSNIAASAITAPKWVATAIGSNNIRAATLDGTDIGELAEADFADATLTRSNDFAASQFVTGVRQLDAGCSTSTIRALTTAMACTQIRGTCAIGSLRACATGTCTVDGVASQCTTTTPGQLLIP